MNGQNNGGAAADAATGKLIDAALNFDAWVRENVGTSRDCPAMFVCNDAGAADALSGLLHAFNRACDCYRIVSAVTRNRRGK
ncbi:MAG: hypothetical protein RBU24_13565 [Kiritimatiellia bacterium]|jgi:hypothetical protein|nr:hypothetical protein [Kiritimatiellia bacterium]